MAGQQVCVNLCFGDAHLELKIFHDRGRFVGSYSNARCDEPFSGQWDKPVQLAIEAGLNVSVISFETQTGQGSPNEKILANILVRAGEDTMMANVTADGRVSTTKGVSLTL